MEEILRNFLVLRNLSPCRDLMRVNDFSVNEKMVDKVNVKMVSTLLNEMGSILADTVESESCQINQFHNKDLSQHQLIWPGECFALYMNVSLLICFKKFVFLMGVCIFAETFGICVKHSSGNSLLKFPTQHKHRWEILFQQICKFLLKYSNIFVKLSSNISLLKFLPQQKSEGKSFILTTRGSIFSNYTKKHWDWSSVNYLFCLPL